MRDKSRHERPVKPSATEPRSPEQTGGSEVEKIVEATRFLIVGVGGTGARFLIDLSRAMKGSGMQFGKLAQNGAIVQAMLIDADQRTFDPRETPDAAILDELGVDDFHLFLPSQDLAFRKNGVFAQCTPGIPGEEDTRGANADVRVGRARYTLLRGESQNPNNPVPAITEAVSTWKNPDQPLLGKAVNVIFVGGLHGGTGPAMSLVAADVLSVLRDVLPDRVRYSRMFALSGESALLDSTMRDGLEDDRRYNYVTSMLYLNRDTYRGGATHFDGQVVPGIPKEVIILDGQSNSTSVPTRGGHYDPIKVAAKAVYADITGERGDADTAQSNIGVKRIEIPAADPTTNDNMPLRRFGVMGACEIVPNPPRVILHAQKRRGLFSDAAGLGSPNEERANEQRQLLLPDNFEELLKRKVTPPTVDEAEFGGEEAPQKVESVVRQFLHERLSEMKNLLGNELEPLTTSLVAGLDEKASTLLNAEGIATAEIFLASVRDFITRLMAQADAELARLSRESAALKVSYRATMDAIRDAKVPQFFGRNRAMKKLGRDVTELCNTLGKMAMGSRDFEAASALVEQVIPAFLEKLTALEAAVALSRETAEHVLSNIQPEYDPQDTAQTPFDHKVNVTLQPPRENPAELRRAMAEGNWTRAAMQRMIAGINLNTTDTDIYSYIGEREAAYVSARSEPFCRPYSLGRVGEQGRIRFVAIPKSKIVLDNNGIPIGATDDLPLPQDGANTFRPSPTHEGSALAYAAFTENHGLTPFDFRYFVESFGRFLSLRPAVREKYFVRKGDMEVMLPPFAEVYANMQYEESGRKGDVHNCQNAPCGLAFYRTPEQQEQSLVKCPGCRAL